MAVQVLVWVLAKELVKGHVKAGVIQLALRLVKTNVKVLVEVGAIPIAILVASKVNNEGAVIGHSRS